MAAVGGAMAAVIVDARAQRLVPVVGVLTGTVREEAWDIISPFIISLRQAGFEEGKTIAFEYRFADNRFDRLPSLAADLVQSQVSLLFTPGGTITALAAKAATTSIPIVFVTGGDPIKAGLVASFNHPGGNITGISLIAGSLNEKRLQLLHEVIPKATRIGVLHNPNNPNSGPELGSLTRAAKDLGVQLQLFEASSLREIEAAFAEMASKRTEALEVMTDPFLNEHFRQIVGVATRQMIPAVYGYREFATAGGLMSYGTNRREAPRQAGLLAARILQGEKPGELPVQQSSKVELVINLKAAKELGLSFPLSLLGRADEVIE
jgi:putative ABC transport system substrate-binding protein